MASAPAPFEANLSHYYVDDTWIRETENKNVIKAQRLANDFHFLDDLTVNNYDLKSEKLLYEIYLRKLELKKNNNKKKKKKKKKEKKQVLRKYI